MHLRYDLFHRLNRTWRAGHDARAQTREIEAREVRVIQFGDEHSRNAVQRSAFFLGDRGERGGRIKRLSGEDHVRTDRYAGQYRQHHPKAVIERHGNAESVLFREAHRHRDIAGVVDDVAMRERGALRIAGSAAGELDIDRVAG